MTDKGNITDLGICSGDAPDEPITILLIDDLDSIVDVMAEVLEAGGYRVITALCGQDGLSLLRENPVDVILCDLCMPHMDGWDVAKAIRNASEEKGVPKPPFLLVTAWADQICGDKRLLESGVDAVIGKPVTFLELAQAIEMALQKPGRIEAQNTYKSSTSGVQKVNDAVRHNLPAGATVTALYLWDQQISVFRATRCCLMMFVYLRKRFKRVLSKPPDPK